MSPRPRRNRWLVALLALWTFGALPLLALPFDWSIVCGCDSCPLGGGPTCCCRNYPTWPNADGSPGKRAAISHPSVEKASSGCVGPASLPSPDDRETETSSPLPGAGAQAAAGSPISLRPSPRRPPLLFASFPRPPPVPA